MRSSRLKARWGYEDDPPWCVEKIERLAERKGLTQKMAVLEVLDRQMMDQTDEVCPGSALEKISDLVCVEQDSDAQANLFTDPEHRQNYGTDAYDQ